MAERTRYSDEELAEFKSIIQEKLEVAQENYRQWQRSMSNTGGNDVTDTSPTLKTLDEGAINSTQEESGRWAQHEMEFIQHLKGALNRIENKTYGICKSCGKLIPKERLEAVPHATKCIECKSKKK